MTTEPEPHSSSSDVLRTFLTDRARRRFGADPNYPALDAGTRGGPGVGPFACCGMLKDIQIVSVRGGIGVKEWLHGSSVAQADDPLDPGHRS